MSNFRGVYRSESRWRATAGATLLLAGSLVAAVGFVAAATSLIAGFGLGKAGALKVAALLGGALLLGGHLVAFCRESSGADSSGRRSSRWSGPTLAGVGTAVGVAGLALFWTSLPTGWTGNLARLPRLALGAYAAGLLAVFGASLAAGLADGGGGPPTANPVEAREGDVGALGGVESVIGSTSEETTGDGAAAPSAMGDGGESEDDLRFFDDEDES
jgi:hypothetical protein